MIGLGRLCSLTKASLRPSLVRSLSEVATSSSSASVSASNDTEANVTKKDLYLLRGMHPFSTRRDVQNLLGNTGTADVPFTAWLDKNYMPMGLWAVDLTNVEPSGREAFTKSVIKKSQQTARALGLPTAARFTCEELSADLESKYKKKYMVLASEVGINNCTVRIKNLHNEVGEDDLRYLFQNFKINKIEELDLKRKKGAVAGGEVGGSKGKGKGDVSQNKPKRSGLVREFTIQFADSTSAELALVQLNGVVCKSRQLNLIWYNI